jgi:hypothetical protein
MAGAALLPGRVSLLAVVLLAGPHNWMELRYFATHMPARWGPHRDWFRLALGGTAVLAFAWIAAGWTALDDPMVFTRTWTSALLVWIALLLSVDGRCRGTGRRVGLFATLAAVVVWAFPVPWDLVLVFAHPLVSLIFLDRELRRHRRGRAALRFGLALLPAACLAVWRHAAPIGGLDPETLDRVTSLAGASIFPEAAPERLVALYAFLQILHYGAWIVAIPSLRLRRPPWSLHGIPLATRFRSAVRFVLGGAAVLAGLLWIGFARSLSATWDLYFQLAIVHVVAELPFLCRKLAAPRRPGKRSLATGRTSSPIPS